MILATNVCICTSHPLDGHTGGVDRILSLAKNVSLHGVNVYLVNRLVGKSPKFFLMDPDKYFQVRRGVISELPYPFYARFFFPGFVKLVQEILRRLLSWITLTDSSEVSASYLMDPHLVVKLLFVCKKEKIDLIQCELPTTGFSSFFVKKALSIPLVYDSHNVETERLRGMANVSSSYVAVTKLVEDAVCSFSDSIFVVSERDRNQYVLRGFPEEKIVVVPNSIDVNRFLKLGEGTEIRKKYNLAERILLIFHGPLNYPPNRKAAELLVDRILPKVWQTYPNVTLLLVGASPPKISSKNIIVTGFVENLYDYIAAADIAVVPLTSGGGTRIKIVEYMASGKAIVSTLKGAEGLNLQNGVDILLTELPDDNFVSNLLKLIADSNLRQCLGSNAQEKASLLYDWGKTAEKAVETYNELTKFGLA